MCGTARASSRPATSSSTPPRGIGIIMTAAAARSRSSEGTARPRARRRMSSSSDMPVPKRSVRRAEAADRARRDLQHHRLEPGRGRAQPQLACTAPSERPSARAAGGGRLRDPGLGGLGQPRRRHVDGLLEEGAVERIGLVEEGQGAEDAALQQAFERHLAARHEVLHQDGVGPLAQLRHVRRAQDLADALEGGHELRRVVRPDHAAAGREHQRLEHARVRHAAAPPRAGPRPPRRW